MPEADKPPASPPTHKLIAAAVAGAGFAAGIALIYAQAHYANGTLYTPFATPTLIVWDTLRIIVIIGGLTVSAAAIYMIAKTSLPARMVLTAALLCLIASAIGTEFEHLGDVATYRLFFNFTGVVLAGGGTWLAARET